MSMDVLPFLKKKGVRSVDRSEFSRVLWSARNPVLLGFFENYNTVLLYYL